MPPRFSPLSSAVLLALSPQASAQHNPSPDPGDTRLAATDLDTITVQGQRLPKASTPKFTAPLIDTPRSVTVIPQQVIQDAGATTLLEALRTVPGITFGAGEGGNPNGDRPFIRGFDTQSSLFVDGIRSSGSQTRETFDIDQIEVTKGPSSAYTGRGSVGGSINLVSKLPKAEDFRSGSIGVGTDNYLRGTLDLNESFDNGVVFRVAAMAHQNEIADRGGPDNQRLGIAPSLAFGVGEDTTATLSYYHLDSDDTPESGIPYNNPFAAGTPNAALNGDGSPINVPHDTYYGWLARDFQRQQTDIGSVMVEHRFDNGFKLRNTARYARSTNDYLWTQPDDSKGNFLLHDAIWRRSNSRVSTTRALTNQTDLSGAFATGAFSHTIAAGLEIAREQTDRDSDTFDAASLPYNSGDPATGACAVYGLGAPSQYWCTTVRNPDPHDPWLGETVRRLDPIRTTTDTRAAWVFDTLDLSEQWLLNLGLRFDSFRTRATSSTQDVRNDSNYWNYQVGVVYKPRENGSVYASYGTSSNPPGVDAGDGADAVSINNEDLEPEHSRNLELGTKWNFLDNRLSLTAALFRTEKTNARVAASRNAPQLNVGKQRVDGIELGISGSLTDRWQVFGGYTHLDSELLKTAPGDTASIGNQFPNTPENSATLWTTYAIAARFSIGGGAFYMDKVYGNTANTRFVPAYTRLDAMASWTINRCSSLRLNVQNLTDKYYFDKAYAAHYASAAPGRSTTLTYDFRF